MSSREQGPKPKRCPCLEKEAAIAKAWVTEAGLRFKDGLTGYCNDCMLKEESLSLQTQPYWWSDEIAQLRITSIYIYIAARRKYTRYRRRKIKDPAREQELYQAYLDAKRPLNIAIAASKAKGLEKQLVEDP